jgi:hypothetical protein
MIDHLKQLLLFITSSSIPSKLPPSPPLDLLPLLCLAFGFLDSFAFTHVLGLAGSPLTIHLISEVPPKEIRWPHNPSEVAVKEPVKRAACASQYKRDKTLNKVKALRIPLLTQHTTT